MRIDGSYPEGYKLVMFLPKEAAEAILRQAVGIDGEAVEGNPAKQFLNKGLRRIPRTPYDHAYLVWLKGRLAASPAHHFPLKMAGENRDILAIYLHDGDWSLIEM